jgi:hypothetical protein
MILNCTNDKIIKHPASSYLLSHRIAILPSKKIMMDVISLAVCIYQTNNGEKIIL